MNNPVELKVYKILYIGGDINIIETLNQTPQLSIETKPNSLLAINYIENTDNKIDAILCEQYIPGLNGVEAYQLMQKKKIITDIPFLLITHKFDPKVIQESIKQGIDDVYLSPLIPEKIVQRISFLKKFKKNQKKETKKQSISTEYKIPIYKRAFDIFASLIALIILSPILILTMIAIRLESKGSVYYTSKRVGTGYKIFDFYKFRSMYIGADKQLKNLGHLNQYNKEETNNTTNDIYSCPRCKELGHPCSPILFIGGKEICEYQYLKEKRNKTNTAFVKIKDDPRVTKVGAFIRKTSIDELPQLINVVKGDMSIVGNRPLPLYEAELLTSDGWGERFLGPAGITGLWQVYKRGKSSMSDEERKALDNQYARNNSFWLDIKIILMTIPALFQKEKV